MQPMTPMLPRLTMTDLHELNTSSGVAFTATLALDGEAFATVENQGNGGCNVYRGLGLREDPAKARANRIKVRELEAEAAKALGMKHEALDFLLCFMDADGITADAAVPYALANRGGAL